YSNSTLFHSDEVQKLIHSYFELDNSLHGLWLYVEGGTFQKDSSDTAVINVPPITKYWERHEGYIRALDKEQSNSMQLDFNGLKVSNKQEAVWFSVSPADQNEPVVRCSYLMRDSENVPFGVFGIDVSLDNLMSTLSDADLDISPYVYLVDNQQVIRKHPNAELIGQSLTDTLQSPELIKWFQLGNTGGVKVYDPFERQEIFNMKRDLNMPGEDKWFLGMRLPVTVARKDFVPIRNFLLMVGFFSFFLTGMFIIYSIFRWRKEKENREQAEMQLSSSSAQLLSYMEGTEHVNIYSIDRNYNYLNFNSLHKRELMRLYGIKPRKGINILNLLPPTIGQILKKHYDRALSGEHFMITIEYERGYYQQVFNPIYGELGSIEGLTCNFIDITDKVISQMELEQYREHLEELVDERTKELRSQKEFFQVLIDQVPNQIFVRDHQGHYLLVNKACAKAFGFLIEEMIGKTILEIHHDDLEAEEFMREDQEILRDGSEVLYEALVTNNLDEQAWVIINKTRISLQNESYVMGVFVDITSLKSTESRLQEANKELSQTIDKLQSMQMKLLESEKMASLGQLMGGIAHEINNPINFVAGNVRPLLQDFDDVRSLLRELDGLGADIGEIKALVDKYDVEMIMNEMESLLHGIQDGAKRIGGIVNNLKTFAKPHSDEFTKANVIEGLNSTINLVSYKVRHRIKLLTNYEKVPDVVCIPAKLNQVFLNLINNAIQAMEGDGEISISTRSLENDKILIEIADSGSGISADIKHKVFEPFFTTKEVGDGTGLGLSLSFSIIQQHKGEISFRENKPRGTVFAIILPVDPLSVQR
ncbi:MAG: ATP-binding protein, partial [Bacteroidota bacterium]